jgi:hypothetical protein
MAELLDFNQLSSQSNQLQGVHAAKVEAPQIQGEGVQMPWGLDGRAAPPSSSLLSKHSCMHLALLKPGQPGCCSGG